MSQSNQGGLSSTFQAVAVAATFLFVLFVVLGALVGSLGAGGEDVRVDASGSSIEVDSQATSVSLVDSTGHGLRYGSGSGSLQAQTDGGVGDGNSTVAIWAELSDDASTTDEWHVANLGNGVVSVQLRDGDWYGYYNQTNGGVAEVSTNATSPRELTQVAIVANGTHLELAVDGTVENTTAFDATSTAGVPAARSWWGTQDELRVWDAPLDESQLATLEADPITTVAHDDLTARLMMDEGSGGQSYVLAHGSQASLSGDLGWTSGLDGQAFVEGEDYTFDGDGTISIVEGSRLDQLHVAYVSYSGRLGELADLAGSALLLAGLIPILLVVATILREITGLGGNNGKRI